MNRPTGRVATLGVYFLHDREMEMRRFIILSQPPNLLACHDLADPPRYILAVSGTSNKTKALGPAGLLAVSSESGVRMSLILREIKGGH